LKITCGRLLLLMTALDGLCSSLQHNGPFFKELQARLIFFLAKLTLKEKS
jgi:hypothetical protein